MHPARQRFFPGVLLWNASLKKKRLRPAEKSRIDPLRAQKPSSPKVTAPSSCAFRPAFRGRRTSYFPFRAGRRLRPWKNKDTGRLPSTLSKTALAKLRKDQRERLPCGHVCVSCFVRRVLCFFSVLLCCGVLVVVLLKVETQGDRLLVRSGAPGAAPIKTGV